MVLSDTRTVAFYDDTTLLGNIVVSEADWNGLDWPKPEWLVNGWAETTNIVSSTLDYFAFSSNDDHAPIPTMNPEPSSSEGDENEVSWGAVTDPGYGGPVTYYVERATDINFTTAVSNSGWIAGTSYIFTDLVNDTTYYYRVKSKDGLGNESDWSNTETSKQIVAPSGGEMSVRKYYYHGGKHVAMRQGNVVYYLHGDHLGSTSLTTSFTQSVIHQARYLPFGGERWRSGAGQTDFTYTGQRVEASFGLHDYNARFYSSRLGRFVSADTIVPDFADSQAWNGYSYVNNNPLIFIDPTGNIGECANDTGQCGYRERPGLPEPSVEECEWFQGYELGVTYEQFLEARQYFYDYANNPDLFFADLEIINGFQDGG